MYAILGLALAMLTVGCSTDTTNDVFEGKTTLGVEILDTRTSLGALEGTEYSVLWTAGDKIAVNGVASDALAAEFNGQKKATFTVSNVAAPYSVLYPAEALAKEGHVFLATEQAYTAGSFAAGAGLLVGYSETYTVPLTNLCGFVKIVINKGGDETLKSVTLRAIGGEAISGSFDVDYRQAAITPVAGKDLIRVSSVDGIPYVDGKATVVVAVPAGEYASSFSVTVVDNAGKAMTKNIKAANVVEAGTMLVMPELTYAGVEQSVVTVTNADELKAAMEASATAETASHIVFGCDIDMTGSTYVTPAQFHGTLDGQGYALKNWNTARGLVAMSFGVVKNVVIDASCTLTPASYANGGVNNVGFVVEDIDADTAIVSGCVNYGKVVVNDVSGIAFRVGGVVGVSYGFLENCANYGEISVTSPTVGNGQFVGGVVGYVNPNTGGKAPLGKDFVANCVNYGKVTVFFACKPNKTYLGGVVGATPVSKSSATTYLGQIVNCVNYGEISYRFETLSSGTYANVGGVIGYSQASVEGCDHHGKVSFTTPTENNTLGGTRPAVGGVVGCNAYAVKNCNNHGEVFVEGRWAAGTNDAEGAGSQGGSSFGGVVGCSGIYKVYNADYPVENCNNYGKVDITNYCLVDGGTKGWHAGVVGYTTNDVKNCHNYGDVTLKHDTYENYTAGVCGETMGSVINCTSNAPVYAEALNVAKAGGGLYFAGIVGYATIGVEDCHLNADFTAKTNNADGSLRFAGICGQIKTASTRTVTITDCSVAKGVKMTFTTDNGKANYCAGIIGLANNGVSNCVNNGDLSITMTELFTDTDVSYAAGVAAAQQEDMYGCYNHGNIYVDMFNATGPFYSATVLADNKKAGAVVSDCHNTGNLTIVNAGNTENVDFIVGHKADETTFNEATCTNTGVVTVNGNVLVPAAPLSIDNKQYQLPAEFGAVLLGPEYPQAVCVADLGVSMPGQLVIGVDNETIYGAVAAGTGTPMVVVAYVVTATSATEGVVTVQQQTMAGVQETTLPYSNLTAEGVTIDFTNLGFGIGAVNCPVYSKAVSFNGGVAM